MELEEIYNSESSTDSEIDDEMLVEGNEDPELGMVSPQIMQDPQDSDEGYDMDDYDEDGALINHTSIDQPMKLKKQLNKEKFASWCASQKTEPKPELTNDGDEMDEDNMSAKFLISSKKFIIHDPREYQLELFEIAKEKNTIAVLDTGSGKTLIACLLLRHTVDQELQNRMQGKQRRTSFFLVDSVTLVFQQAAVLECNLDSPIGKYCGAMGTDLWSKEQWQEIMNREQVIVMTADVLYNCLVCGLVKMGDINLICLDEVHHAKKNHVYARIIKEFYADEPEDSRPKIFGMTASPVDSRDDPTDAALELERLLHSRIATASDLSLLKSSVSRPDEQILPYSRLEPPFRTALYDALYEKFHKIKCLKRIFYFCLECTSELGAWCADEVWKVALSETEAQKIESRNERLLNRTQDKAANDKVEMEIQMIRQARDIVANHDFRDPELSVPDVSEKVLRLQHFLESIYSVDTDEKCIIFVTQRYTAHCLAALLKHTGPAFLRLGILIGTRKGRPGEENVTFKQQMVKVSRFRRGTLNCLIATSVAEEGLDIPDCSKIVRFDLYSTMIQYIQSRGRARHCNSKYVQMIEATNHDHIRRITEVRKAETVMREFCQRLPEDRIIKGPGIFMEESLPGTFYIEPSTGAKLTPSAALQLLWRFTNNLPKESDYSVPPTYYIKPTKDTTFTCEIILPPNSPVLSVKGKPCKTKAEAKQSAAFAACVLLREKGFLNDHLLPLHHGRLTPKGANAILNLDNEKANTYQLRQKPSFWNVVGPLPGHLYVTVFGLTTPEPMGRPYQPLCVVTREAIPPIPSFTIYADQGGESEVYAVTLKETLPLSPDTLGMLNQFTNRFFHDVFAKTFEITPDIPYWILPVRNVPIHEDCTLESIIDSALVELVMGNEELSWDENTPLEFFENRFLLHKLSRSRRFFTQCAVPDLTPQSDIPVGACTVPKSATIYDYSYFERQRGLDYPRPEFNRRQPVLLASRVLHRINYLDPPPLREKMTPLRAYIIPSAFEISCLPPSFAAFSICFPAISTRLDAYLHARDVCNLMGINISLDLALEAITKDSDHAENDNVITIGPKKGMGSNYERLEFLGDTFLKLATTLSLFVSFDEDDEYQLHVKRMHMVCNNTLFRNALAIKLPEYIQTQGFSRREWYPRLKLLVGRRSKKQKIIERLRLEKEAAEKKAAEGKEEGTTEDKEAQEETTVNASKPDSGPITTQNEILQLMIPTHKLAPKTIADVCEALIGAAVEDKGFDEAITVINTVVNSSDHDKTKFTHWKSYREHYKIPSYQIATPLARHLDLVQQIEGKIGYRFKYPRLLASAFVHPSIPYSWENIPCYQRLEFLGDSLHDQACIRYIYDKYPDKGPQWLTEHKMAMVSNKFLASLAVKLEFHRHLRKNGTMMISAIQTFVEEVKQAELAAEGAIDFWVHVTGSIPKALGDCLEAFIGAMFVDAEFDFSVVEMFFDKFIKPYFVDMTIYDTYAGNHPTTLLTTKLKEVGCEDWRILSEEITEQDTTYIYAGVMVHNAVFAFGKAHSVKNARLKASQMALDKMADMGLTKFLRICDCASARERLRELKARQKEAEKLARLAGLEIPGEGGRSGAGSGGEVALGRMETKLGIEIRKLQEELDGKLAVEIQV